MKKSFLFLLIAIITLLVGVIIGRYSTKISTPEKEPLYWVDSMEPTIHYPGPGKSRMGMELTPVYAEEQETDQGIRISPSIVNNLGIRTTLVTQGNFAKKIAAVGYVEPNENKISHIHTYAEGWIRNLFVKAVGEPVKKNQVIIQLYSPLLVNAQEEYLIALDSGNKDLIDASYKRLQSFHISEQQIQKLKTTKKSSQLIDIYPHQDGVVTALNVREGMKVTPETEIMSIVDLSSIWMIAQVYEDQAEWVKIGQQAEATLTAYPEKIWKGEVEYIYPELDPNTRTLKVRFRFNNPDGILKPNMYANISLFTEPKQNVLSIPLESLIRSSEGNRVIVMLNDGRFQARLVTVGMESGDRVEILSGLKVGEKIVTSGQFLIDSETNLKSGLARLDESVKQDTSSTPSEPLIEGKGIIKKIDFSNNKITLQHEPISALNWPEMTMDFSVEKNVELKLFKIGDSIKFFLRKNGDNNYIIIEMKKSN